MQQKRFKEKQGLYKGLAEQAPAGLTAPSVNNTGLVNAAQLSAAGLGVARANNQLTSQLAIDNMTDAVRQGFVNQALSASIGAAKLPGEIQAANFDISA
jgi:hypothetical protein